MINFRLRINEAILSDVMNISIRFNKAEHTSLLGAVMFAATAAWIYEKLEDVMNGMWCCFDAVYHPDAKRFTLYEDRFIKYNAIGEFFGL